MTTCRGLNKRSHESGVPRREKLVARNSISKSVLWEEGFCWKGVKVDGARGPTAGYPRKQSHAWGRSSNNTKSVHLGLVMVFSMSYSFRSDVRLFSFRPQVHQVGRDSEQPPRRGFPPRMFDECFSISLVTTPTNSRPGSTCKSCGHFKGQRL